MDGCRPWFRGPSHTAAAGLGSLVSSLSSRDNLCSPHSGAGTKGRVTLNEPECKVYAREPGTRTRAGSSRGVGPGPVLVLQAPSAAKGLVELDERDELVPAGLCQRGFGREEQLLCLEHLVVARLPRGIALGRYLDRVLIGADGAFLLRAHLGQPAAGRERVRHVAEGVERRLLVAELRRLPGRLRLLVLAVEPATLEERPGSPGADR